MPNRKANRGLGAPPGERPRIFVAGAGLTGMSAALTLAARGVQHRIVEAASQPGGLARTFCERGYRFDRTGHLLHLRHPALRQQVLEWLGSGLRTIRRNSAIWFRGRYSPYPFQANTHALPPEVAYECVMGFLRARAMTTPASPGNFEEFCLQHFGEGFSRHFMLPYNRRLWGVDPKDISHSWCQRFVPIPTVEDVIAGAVGVEQRALGYNAEFYYPATGIGELAGAMHARLPHIEMEKPLRSVDPARRQLRFDDETVTYEHLISTLPLSALLAVVEGLPESVAQAAKRLRHTNLYYLDIALSAPCRQPYHWIYVPEDEYPFYRVGCYSHFSPSMAPPNTANLYVELVDRRTPNTDVLAPQVADSLVAMGIIQDSSEILFTRVRHIPVAYVLYDHEHQTATRVAQDYLRSHGIISTGRYGAWNYSSMEDALLDGERAALSLFANS